MSVWPVTFRAETDELFDTTSMSILEGGKEILLAGMARYRYRIFSPVFADSRIIPFIDVGAFFYYRHVNFKPVVSLDYPDHETEFSIGTAIIPGIKINITDRFYIDFSVPIDLAETFLTINHTDQPTLPIASRTTTTLSIFAFRRWNAQVGAGIYL